MADGPDPARRTGAADDDVLARLGLVGAPPTGGRATRRRAAEGPSAAGRRRGTGGSASAVDQETAAEQAHAADATTTGPPSHAGPPFLAAAHPKPADRGRRSRGRSGWPAGRPGAARAARPAAGQWGHRNTRGVDSARERLAADARAERTIAAAASGRPTTPPPTGGAIASAERTAASPRRTDGHRSSPRRTDNRRRLDRTGDRRRQGRTGGRGHARERMACDHSMTGGPPTPAQGEQPSSAPRTDGGHRPHRTGGRARWAAVGRTHGRMPAAEPQEAAKGARMNPGCRRRRDAWGRRRQGAEQSRCRVHREARDVGQVTRAYSASTDPHRLTAARGPHARVSRDPQAPPTPHPKRRPNLLGWPRSRSRR